jgi:mannose-6-phosphate isomerase-like protein (cupin superfamily)
VILPVRKSWGNYIVIWLQAGIKVKILNIRPGMSTSMQKHDFRSEWWMILSGELTLDTMIADKKVFKKFEQYYMGDHLFHKLSNETTEPLRILEVQYGEKCEEEDIERVE